LRYGTPKWLGVGAAVAAAGLAYHTALRPRMNRWGATQTEARRPLPGDELSPDPFLHSTRAITIDAPPYAVWPWIAQVGYGRAGWYSYDWVERLMFAGRYAEGHSATWIHPELQDLREGDVVPFGVGVRIPVTAIEPEKYLVIGKSWAFVLEDLSDGRTRLLVRTRGPGWVRAPLQRIPVLRQIGAAIDYAIGEPLHHFMERKMMLGVAERAEALVRI